MTRAVPHTIARLLVISLTFSAAACRDEPITLPTSPQPGAASMTVRPDTEPGRYIVFLKDGAGDVLGKAKTLVALAGGQRLAHFTHAPSGFAVRGLTPAAVALLRKHPLVKAVVPDVKGSYASVTSAPAASATYWGLDRVDQQVSRGEFRYDDTFKYAFNGAGTHIYIVDDGIDATHTEFTGRIGASVTIWPTAGSPFPANAQHGTAAAGAAAGSNGGTARGATLHSVKVSDTDEGPWLSTMLSGLDWIMDNGQHPGVVSISLYFDSSFSGLEGYQSHIENLIAHGFIVVKAGGNFNNDACNDGGNRAQGVIVVAASDQNDNPSNWGGGQASAWGNCVSLYAPGSAVRVALSSQPAGNNSTLADQSGTSISAPFVAGIAAQMAQESPTLGSWTAKYILQTSARPVIGGAPAGTMAILVNSMHPFVSINGPGYIDSREAQNITYSVGQTMGGDGTWSNFKWYRSINNGPEVLVGTGPTYVQSYSLGENANYAFRLTGESFGITAEYLFGTMVVYIDCPIGQDSC